MVSGEIEFHAKRFEPDKATVASGTRIRICNKSEVNTHVFSLSPSAKHTTVRNPTSKPLRLGLYDEIHSKVRLELTIRPEP